MKEVGIEDEEWSYESPVRCRVNTMDLHGT